MNDARRISPELRPYVDRGEADELDGLGRRLYEGHIAPPRPAFKAQLRNRLVELERRQLGASERPQRLWLAIASFTGAGLALLGIAALAATGSGPVF